MRIIPTKENDYILKLFIQKTGKIIVFIQLMRVFT